MHSIEHTHDMRRFANLTPLVLVDLNVDNPVRNVRFSFLVG
jgi:hypothetical protein